MIVYTNMVARQNSVQKNEELANTVNSKTWLFCNFSAKLSNNGWKTFVKGCYADITVCANDHYYNAGINLKTIHFLLQGTIFV